MAAYFPIDVLQHNVLRFKIPVYDLVLVEILDTRSCGDRTVVFTRRHPLSEPRGCVEEETLRGRTNVVEQ